MCPYMLCLVVSACEIYCAYHMHQNPCLFPPTSWLLAVRYFYPLFFLTLARVLSLSLSTSLSPSSQFSLSWFRRGPRVTRLQYERLDNDLTQGRHRLRGDMTWLLISQMWHDGQTWDQLLAGDQLIFARDVQNRLRRVFLTCSCIYSCRCLLCYYCCSCDSQYFMFVHGHRTYTVIIYRYLPRTRRVGQIPCR